MVKLTVWLFGVVFSGLLFSGAASANDVEVVKVRFEASGGAWRVRRRLGHGDSGWGHYADAWRVVNGKGAVLGTRTLLRPHEN